MKMGVALMNRAEEVQLFRKSREVSVLPGRDDLVLSVLNEPLAPDPPPNHSTTEDEDTIARVKPCLIQKQIPISG